MEDATAPQGQSLCPSAQPDMVGSVIFGVIGGTVAAPQLTYLSEPRPVTAEVLTLATPVNPTEVFRFAAPCAEERCRHYDGTQCRLASRIGRLLPPVVERVAACHLRPTCRWWQQEGKAACLRCPQIVTETYYPSDQLRRAAGGQGDAGDNR